MMRAMTALVMGALLAGCAMESGEETTSETDDTSQAQVAGDIAFAANVGPTQREGECGSSRASKFRKHVPDFPHVVVGPVPER